MNEDLSRACVTPLKLTKERRLRENPETRPVLCFRDSNTCGQIPAVARWTVSAGISADRGHIIKEWLSASREVPFLDAATVCACDPAV